MNIKKAIKFNSQRFIRNKYTELEDNTPLYINSKNRHNNNININETESLDWENYRSIYNHLISYINLMIIDLSKDKKKLCKYLKDIFYAIFKISQEIKNNNKIIIDDNNNNDSLKTKQKSDNDDWNFLTGEQNIYTNNVNLMEQMLKDEENNEKNIIKPLLTQRYDKSKSFNNFKSSPFKTKLDRLQKKFKQKEKQYKIDKLNYLLRISEQNNLIDKLEKEITINNINNMTQRDFNKIKCFPDFSFVKENYLKTNTSINSHIKSFDSIKEKENEIINNIKYLNIAKSNKEEKKYNLKDVIAKNLSLLNNNEKKKKIKFMRFANFSFFDTKIKIKNIKNYHF